MYLIATAVVLEVLFTAALRYIHSKNRCLFLCRARVIEGSPQE